MTTYFLLGRVRRLACRKGFVIGGDTGIGRAAAIEFARERADVFINFVPPLMRKRKIIERAREAIAAACHAGVTTNTTAN